MAAQDLLGRNFSVGQLGSLRLALAMCLFEMRVSEVTAWALRSSMPGISISNQKRSSARHLGSRAGGGRGYVVEPMGD